MPARTASTLRAMPARSSASGCIGRWRRSTACRRRRATAERGARDSLSAARTALLDEGAQAILRRVGHGHVAEILDRVGDAAAVVEIVLPHEGGAPEPHDGRRLLGEGFGQ